MVRYIMQGGCCMNAGKIKISKRLLQDALQLPSDWIIGVIDDYDEDTMEMTIFGKEFPLIENEKIKECSLTVTKENISFKVEEIGP